MWGGRRANLLKPFRSLFHVSCLNLKTPSDDEHLASNHMKSWLEKLLCCQSKGNSRDGVMCEGCLCGNSRLQCTVELYFIESGKTPNYQCRFLLQFQRLFFCRRLCCLTGWGQTSGNPPQWMLQRQVARNHGLSQVTRSTVGLRLLQPAPPSYKLLKSAVKSSSC